MTWHLHGNKRVVWHVSFVKELNLFFFFFSIKWLFCPKTHSTWYQSFICLFTQFIKPTYKPKNRGYM